MGHVRSIHQALTVSKYQKNERTCFLYGVSLGFPILSGHVTRKLLPIDSRLSRRLPKTGGPTYIYCEKNTLIFISKKKKKTSFYFKKKFLLFCHGFLSDLKLIIGNKKKISPEIKSNPGLMSLKIKAV